MYLFADAIKMQDLVPLAIFGMFAALAWWLLDVMGGRRPRTLERLDELRNPQVRRPTQEMGAVKKTAAVTKMLEKASPLARPLEPKSEAEAGKIRARLSAAGFRSESVSRIFLSLKFAGLLTGLIFGGTLLPFVGISQKSLMYLGLLAAFLFYLPDIVVALIASGRKQNIFLGLPDALDLMVVCVEAGLGLDQAMRKVSDEMRHTYHIISDEFALCNSQLQLGKPRNEVLQDLGARTGVQDLRTLAAVLIQADRFGSSVALALRVQSDSMRTRRRQLAEEKAAKTAVKLIFPLVLFIFPGIFVVLVGPAAITMVRQMFPMMGG